MLASHFPFKRIVGVEVSPHHHQIAKRNLATYDASGRQCDEIEALCMDAGEYEFPQSNLVIYMYQPFVGHVFKRVLDRIAGLDDRAVFLCCSAPWPANLKVLTEHPALLHLKSYLTLSAEQDWLLRDPNAKGRHEFETQNDVST